MKKNIELYGEVIKTESIHAHTQLVYVKETKTGIDWEVICDDLRCDADLEAGLHVHVKGEKALIAKYGIYANSIDEWGRICTHCGKHVTSGYQVGGDYACSQMCAIALYDGDEDAFRADLALLDDPETADDAPTYWTEWE